MGSATTPLACSHLQATLFLVFQNCRNSMQEVGWKSLNCMISHDHLQARFFLPDLQHDFSYLVDSNQGGVIRCAFGVIHSSVGLASDCTMWSCPELQDGKLQKLMDSSYCQQFWYSILCLTTLTFGTGDLMSPSPNWVPFFWWTLVGCPNPRMVHQSTDPSLHGLLDLLLCEALLQLGEALGRWNPGPMSTANFEMVRTQICSRIMLLYCYCYYVYLCKWHDMYILYKYVQCM